MARVNVFDPDWEPRDPDDPAPFTARGAWIGRPAGARELGASLYELRSGEAICPFHLHHANEEMIIVLAGRPTLRTFDGERELETGEVVACPRGRAGAHRVDNHGDEVARVLIVSTMNAPEVAEYPDSGKILARSNLDPKSDDWLRKIFRADSGVDYFDGET
jgi:uncharacterized cupin superfamily protein